MLYIVRGKTPDHHDRTLRIDAESMDQAEAIGWARGIFVTEVVSQDEQALRRSQRLAALWETVRRWIVPRTTILFGRRVTAGQSVAFLLGGVATWAIDLRAFHFV